MKELWLLKKTMSVAIICDNYDGGRAGKSETMGLCLYALDHVKNVEF